MAISTERRTEQSASVAHPPAYWPDAVDLSAAAFYWPEAVEFLCGYVTRLLRRKKRSFA